MNRGVEYLFPVHGSDVAARLIRGCWLKSFEVLPICLHRRHHDRQSANSSRSKYLRMSTEHQQYSLENQSTAMQKYAESHDFEVVHTYSDAAKSGIVLKRRTGLQQLLQDVVSGNAPFRRSWSTMSAVGDAFRTPTNPPITSFCANRRVFRCITARRHLPTTAAFRA